MAGGCCKGKCWSESSRWGTPHRSSPSPGLRTNRKGGAMVFPSPLRVSREPTVSRTVRYQGPHIFPPPLSQPLLFTLPPNPNTKRAQQCEMLRASRARRSGNGYQLGIRCCCVPEGSGGGAARLVWCVFGRWWLVCVRQVLGAWTTSTSALSSASSCSRATSLSLGRSWRPSCTRPKVGRGWEAIQAPPSLLTRG